jgi:nitroreductase
MTSAALVGIDSCPIEGFIKKKQRLYYEKFVDTEKYGLSFMVAFGYRKADPANPKSRRKNRGYCYLENSNCFTFNYMSILGSKELLLNPKK